MTTTTTTSITRIAVKTIIRAIHISKSTRKPTTIKSSQDADEMAVLSQGGDNLIHAIKSSTPNTFNGSQENIKAMHGMMPESLDPVSKELVDNVFGPNHPKPDDLNNDKLQNDHATALGHPW